MLFRYQAKSNCKLFIKEYLICVSLWGEDSFEIYVNDNATNSETWCFKRLEQDLVSSKQPILCQNCEKGDFIMSHIVYPGHVVDHRVVMLIEKAPLSTSFLETGYAY